MSKLLDIGTTIYTVEESIVDRWFYDEPYHFEIVSGQISRIIHGGYKQYVVQAVNRLGRKSNLLYLKTSNLGKSFFLTLEECEAFAEKATQDYERRWKETLCRPWEK